MYLPTGTPHAARAQEGASLHVTLGINQLTWRGLLRRTVDRLVAEVPDDHLPAGYLDDPSLLSTPLAARLAALADDVRAVDPAGAVDAEAERFLTTRPTAAARRAPRRARRPRPRRRHACCAGAPAGRASCWRAATADRVRVLLGDRVLEMPAWLRPALEELRGRRAS